MTIYKDLRLKRLKREERKASWGISWGIYIPSPWVVLLSAICPYLEAPTLSRHLRLACRAKTLIGADREPIKKIVDFSGGFFPQKKLASYAKRLERP
jgi:hypothetical protein